MSKRQEPTDVEDVAWVTTKMHLSPDTARLQVNHGSPSRDPDAKAKGASELSIGPFTRCQCNQISNLRNKRMGTSLNRSQPLGDET